MSVSGVARGVGHVSDPIKKDHRELEEYYQRITESSNPDEQVRYQNQFVWELARHSIGEELVVYPAMEEHVEDGKARADRGRADHQKVKEQLHKFQKLSPGDPEFLPTIQALWKDLSEHNKDEEENDLPALEAGLEMQGDKSEQLARSFQRTKHFVPTRSHPNAPDKPPFETVVGLMAAPLDKLTDMFRKFPKD